MTVEPAFIDMIDRNLNYYSGLFGEDNFAMDTLCNHQEGLRRSIQFGATAKQTNEKAADLFIRTFPFIEQQGNYKPWIQTAIRIANRYQSKDTYSLTRVVALLGFLHQEMGHTHRAETAFRKAEMLALESKDVAAVANAWYYLGVLEYRNYHSAEAQNYLKRSKKLLENNLDLDVKDNRIIYGSVLNLLGMIAQQRHQFDKTEAYLRKAKQVFEGLNDEYFISLIDINLGYLYANVGQPDRAIKILRQAVDFSQEKGLMLRHAEASLRLGGIYFQQGMWQEALDIYNQVHIVELQKRGQVKYIAFIKKDLANCLIKTGDYEIAQLHLEESLPMWEQICEEVQYANSLGAIGHIHRLRGDYEKARQNYQTAQRMLRGFENEPRAQCYLEEIEMSLYEMNGV